MGRLRTGIKTLANRLLQPVGCQIVPNWMLNENGGKDHPKFQLWGKEYPYFVHHYNCGWPPHAATERTIELSVADYWLDHLPSDQVVEVGAVTPYYWPGRVHKIVDPADTSKYVTDRKLISEIDLAGRAVLSISTFEHIGKGDYNLPDRPESLRDAIAQLLRQSSQFLVTVPLGYNNGMDDLLSDRELFRGIRFAYLVRQPDGSGWLEVPEPSARNRSYGNSGANTVVILERGIILGA